jgi:hypothetical protein
MGSEPTVRKSEPTLMANNRRPFPELNERPNDDESPRAVCPVCGGRLLEIHGKLCCVQCHSIVETCCD